MPLLMLGCARRLFALALLLALAAAAWLFRDPLLQQWGRLRPEIAGVLVPADPGEDLSSAETGAAKLESLQRTEGPRRVALGDEEAQALAGAWLPPHLPDYVLNPRLRFHDDRLRLLARLVVPSVPAIEELGEVAAFLPDTADVVVTGKLLPLDADRVAFAVDGVTAERIPLPRRLVPVLLQRLGRVPEPGLPPDALALRLPAGADAAYIRRDSLVLLRATPAAEE